MNEYVKLILAGREYNLCFKVGAIRMLKKKFGIDLIEMFRELKGLGAITEYMPEIIYSAAACYCSIEKKPVDFTIEDITSGIDGLDLEKFVPIINIVYNEYLKVLQDKTASPEVKEAEEEPFHVAENGTGVSGTNDDASVGTGSIHVQRPYLQAAGIQ